MTAFQVTALSVLGVLFVVSFGNVVRRKGRPSISLLWTLLWVASAVAVAKPSVTHVVANALGIGRGADLVLYAAVFMTMIGFFIVYTRIRRLRREVTVLTRALAIARARLPEPRDEASDAPARSPSEV